MKSADIPDERVIELARRWRREGGPGVVARLVAEGVPEKLALHKVERLLQRRQLECGVSPNCAWPATAR